MTAIVLLLVLAAAILHAGWNALAKKGGDPLARMALIAGGSAVCGLPIALYLGAPNRQSWLMLGGSITVHQAYYSFLILGYRHGDLSTVYPIARGSAPMLVAVGAAIFVNETLDAMAILSIAVISAGVASLAFLGESEQKNRRGVFYALASAVTIAVYSIFDGLGGRLAGDTLLSYIAWLFVLQGIPVVLFALLRRWSELGTVVRVNWRGGLGGGAAAIIAYGLVIWAMSVTPMSYVAALREVSVIIAAVIGTRLLGEPFGNKRVVASVVVACGVVLLQVTRP